MSTDRSRELRLAAQRAAEAERGRQQARADHQAASEQVVALTGSWLHRRDLAVTRDRLVLTEHALQTTGRQADQAAERLGILRREQQRRLGWMEAHDAELRAQERALARELGWRGRVDQRALVLAPPGWLLAELGPVPSDPQERAVWRVAAAGLDAYQRAYGLDHERPAKHVGGRAAVRDGRARASAGRRSYSEHPRQPLRVRRDPTAAEERHRIDPGRLLGAEPRRDTPGRRRDWQRVRAALERLADQRRRCRDERHTLERAGRRRGRDLGRQERDGR